MACRCLTVLYFPFSLSTPGNGAVLVFMACCDCFFVQSMPRASKQQARYAVGRCLMLWSSNDVTQQGSRPKTKLGISMSTLREFETLSIETGIALPNLLQNLLATQKTLYGSEWKSKWRERMLEGTAPLSTLYDFEWVEATNSRKIIQEWLNPEAQNGKAFLPFAESGAGDAYCLMPVNETTIGVALVLHDDETSQINHQSFDDFIVAHFLEIFSNLNHLADDFSAEEILRCVKSDVWFVTEFMDTQKQKYLREFCSRPLILREFRHNQKARPQNVLSLISQEHYEAELSKYTRPNVPPFPVVPRWEVPPACEISPNKLDPEPDPDWRTYAMNPKQKLMAIQSYRQEFGVSIAEAKVAIEHYIEDAAKNT